MIFLFSLSAFIFSATSTKVISQNKTDEKKNIKQPPSLLVFDDSKNYSLQNTTAVLAEVLAPSPEISFSTIKQEQDQLGFTHKKLQQYFKGVKVEFGTVNLHSAEGKVKSISTEYYPINEDFTVSPGISNIQAFNRAISHTGAQKYMWEFPDAALEMDNYQKPTGELVILPDFNSGRDVADITSYKLAYKFDIFAVNPMSRGNLYIDANNGQALFYDAIIKHATTFGHVGEVRATVETEETFCERIDAEDTFMLVSGTAATRYSGTQTIETALSGSSYILSDASRKVYTRDALNQAPTNTSYPYVNNYQQFTDNDNNWTSAEHSANKDNAALDAHWGAMKTYDYWLNVHSRNSYNGSGAQIRSYVHVDNNYDNAFWNGSVMSYGDGSSNGNEGNGYFDALTSIDVAAHEIGHAVTEYTANLAYQRESGGLNEGFSDIWGAAVEHYAKGNGNDANPDASIWLIGDEIDRRSGSVGLRSMSNPNARSQPDTYGGTYWINPNCGTPTNSNDYCGVHTNSGVLNFWFYLSVVGGSGTNDIGSAYNVSGIGMTKAAAISYRTINNYLSANSTFANARTGAIQSAIDLYGADSPEEIAVTNAWHAVGVGAAYGGGGGGSNYCASASTNVNDEYISRVQLNTINNASGAQFYSDFTSISTDLTEGESYTITVTPTWTGSTYAEGYSVWIDYNGDNDFSDAGEQVWSKAASTNTPNSGTFTVPTGTVGTATRMRVSMKYNGIPTSCETFNYGEVEDYTVNLGGATADTEAPSVPASLTASGATQTTVDLAWNASTDNVGVTGYDVYQGTTNLGTVTGTTAQITGLTASTAYSFRVRAKDDAGNVSGYSNTATISTTGSGGGSACTGGISSFPYSESFESGLGAWSQSSADDIDWTRDASGTPSSNTGPSSGAAGSWYLYVEASSPNYPSKSAILNSPCLDLSAVSAANFNFSYHMYGANDMGSIAVEASDDNGGSWTSLWSESGNKGNSWLSATIDLSAYAGGNVQLRFNRVTGTTWQADIAIDNVSVTTGSGGGGTPPTGYCASNGNNTSDEYIQRVQVGSINNATGASAGGYGDYTSISTNLSGTNTITITPAWTGTVYSEGYAVWIDYNRDGDFGDSGELVYSRSASTATSVSGSFTVPGSASAGPTRMRVSMKYNGIPTSCESFSYGEVEDYLVVLGGSNPFNQGVMGGTNTTVLGATDAKLNLYPNPVQGTTLNVEVIGATATDYVVYNLVGQVVAKSAFEHTIDVSLLQTGVYILQVNAGDEKFIERFVRE
ncbi:Por secretion system C-terminal sorting domain-containing protein [Ulvibacter litoralis]|uniref:Por secretion system C-terminal sorting domain-containing protein n=2 Tax=Ulvibacter litoralis TaxID=227084 RepID=A0A1G7D4I9_9FLAO|nr:Por secretion system C-terminal sorting domain-containing protein [Ulvibacter litoralis]